MKMMIPDHARDSCRSLAGFVPYVVGLILEKVPAVHLPEFTDSKPSYSRSVRVFPVFE
jgi:hypothetical protein